MMTRIWIGVATYHEPDAFAPVIVTARSMDECTRVLHDTVVEFLRTIALAEEADDVVLFVEDNFEDWLRHEPQEHAIG